MGQSWRYIDTTFIPYESNSKMRHHWILWVTSSSTHPDVNLLCVGFSAILDLIEVGFATSRTNSPITKFVSDLFSDRAHGCFIFADTGYVGHWVHRSMYRLSNLHASLSGLCIHWFTPNLLESELNTFILTFPVPSLKHLPIHSVDGIWKSL